MAIWTKERASHPLLLFCHKQVLASENRGKTINTMRKRHGKIKIKLKKSVKSK